MFPALKTDTLAECFIRVARKNWPRRCISDASGMSLNYGRTLCGALALAEHLDKLTAAHERVGIMLPPSVLAALANIAVTLLGKVPVNLSYVATAESRAYAIEQCGIKCVISSRALAEKVNNLGAMPGLVLIEDVAAWFNRLVKVKSYLKAMFVPRKFLARVARSRAEDPATIIFSSGSTGQPKGVVLSHRNIISNIESLRSVFRLYPNDNVVAVLPFFHAFGLTCSLWLPVVSGLSASYVPNPLDGVLVGEVARRNGSTILFAAPTFLSNYVRRTPADDFATLRSVIVGAEKLDANIADAFEAKFGVKPLEGYGMTEMSPVVSLNLPDEEKSGTLHRRNKPGTVGRPIPGVAVKIVSPKTGRPLPSGSDGLLMVKGPNLMLGYLNDPQRTAEVIKDGWYCTGDAASIDEDGFLTIKGRLSRFSKIGGEMVPHLGIEDVYHRGLNADERLVAVTGIPEPRKGEELVVLYMEKAGHPDTLHEIISRSDLPNMWKPKRSNYIRIDSMPVLGSGKLDIRRLKELALAAGAGQKDAADAQSPRADSSRKESRRLRQISLKLRE